MGRGAAGEVRCGILRLRGALTGLRDTGVCAGAGLPGRRGKASLKSPCPEPPALLPTVLGAAGDQNHLPTPRHSLELRKVFQSCFGRGSHRRRGSREDTWCCSPGQPLPPSSWPRCPHRCLSPPASAPAGPAALSTRVEPTWPGLLGTRLPRALSRGVLSERPKASP